MMKNVFWFSYLNSCGGTETTLFNIIKKYGADHDITIYFKNADLQQALRMSQYADVKKWGGEEIFCEKFFCNYNNEILEYVHANEYCQVIHADYKAQGVKPHTHEKITKYIGVSDLVSESFEELTDIKAEKCYNPVDTNPKPRKVLNLISATRLTKEKGKGRMLQLAEMFDTAGIPFIWTVYTNDVNPIPHPSIIFRRPRLDIIDYIANADYLVHFRASSVN